MNPPCLPPAAPALKCPLSSITDKLQEAQIIISNKYLDLFCIMLATRSCVKLGRGNKPPHDLVLPCDPHSSWAVKGMLQHWQKFILELLCPKGKGIWVWITAMKKYKYGHSSIYLSSQNSAAEHGNSALGLETNFPELTDLNRAPAAFLYLGYEWKLDNSRKLKILRLSCKTDMSV